MPTLAERMDALLDRWNQSTGSERMSLLLEYIKLKEALAEQSSAKSSPT